MDTYNPKDRKRLTGRQGIIAWVNPRYYNLERWAYTFHRLSGVIIAGFFFAHIFETNSVAFGEKAWVATVKAVHFGLPSPLGNIPLFLLLIAIIYHTLNGFRLVLIETGFLVGHPRLINFPYKPKSLGKRQRLSFWLSVAIGIILLAYGGIILLLPH